MACILTADIGGTNCRLALFRHVGDTLRCERTVWLPTHGTHSAGDVLDAMERELDTVTANADALVLAVAGPVLDPMRGTTTNAHLYLDLHSVLHRLPHQESRVRACVVNDFTAQAYACLTEPGIHARLVLAPSLPEGFGPRGILGAGTGYGTASLVRDTAGNWLAVPAETGHTTFPFVGPDESEFARFAARERGVAFLRPDDVLTGCGLSLLYLFLEGERLSALEVAARALQSETPTLRWYARWYGRMCRNWALTTLCRGGLYIAGGIAARNPLVVDCSTFAEAFYSTPQYANLLQTIPVRLVTDEQAGLWGAAWIGASMISVPGAFQR